MSLLDPQFASGEPKERTCKTIQEAYKKNLPNIYSTHVFRYNNCPRDLDTLIIPRRNIRDRVWALRRKYPLVNTHGKRYDS